MEEAVNALRAYIEDNFKQVHIDNIALKKELEETNLNSSALSKSLQYVTQKFKEVENMHGSYQQQIAHYQKEIAMLHLQLSLSQKREAEHLKTIEALEATKGRYN